MMAATGGRGSSARCRADRDRRPGPRPDRPGAAGRALRRRDDPRRARHADAGRPRRRGAYARPDDAAGVVDSATRSARPRRSTRPLRAGDVRRRASAPATSVPALAQPRPLGEDPPPDRARSRLDGAGSRSRHPRSSRGRRSWRSWSGCPEALAGTPTALASTASRPTAAIRPCDRGMHHLAVEGLGFGGGVLSTASPPAVVADMIRPRRCPAAYTGVLPSERCVPYARAVLLAPRALRRPRAGRRPARGLTSTHPVVRVGGSIGACPHAA